MVKPTLKNKLCGPRSHTGRVRMLHAIAELLHKKNKNHDKNRGCVLLTTASTYVGDTQVANPFESGEYKNRPTNKSGLRTLLKNDRDLLDLGFIPVPLPQQMVLSKARGGPNQNCQDMCQKTDSLDKK